MVGLGPDDFGGPDLEGCNELLNVTRPDVVAALHEGVPRGRRGRGRDEHLRGLRGAPRRIRDRRPGLRAGPAAGSIARASPRTSPLPTGAAGSQGRSVRGPARCLGPDPIPLNCERSTNTARGSARGRRRPLRHRDACTTCCAEGRDGRAAGVDQAGGRQVPIQAQVTFELPAGCCPAPRSGRPSRRSTAPPRHLRPNCATGPEEMFERLRHLVSTPALPSRSSRMPGCPSSRRRDASTT